jgi:DNA-binding NtrC family response regulator
MFANRYGRPLWKPDPDSLKRFCEFPWPGNVRQLSHIIEQSYVLDCAPMLPHAEPLVRTDATLPFMDLTRLRTAAIQQALETTRGHKGRAARLLGVHANTLTRMLAQMESENPGSSTAWRATKSRRPKPR